jgi:putative salt-induced outer membrane protein YdiY
MMSEPDVKGEGMMNNPVEKNNLFQKRNLCFPLCVLAMVTLLVNRNPARAEEQGGWARSLSLGLNLSQGNSDTSLFTLNFLAEKENGGPSQSSWRLGTEASYGRGDEGEDTANNVRGFLDYKRWFSVRGYWATGTSILSDAVADIDYRLVLGPSVGYYFKRNPRTRLNAEIGPSYIREKIGGEEEDFASARVAERYEHIFSRTAKWWQSAEYLPDLRDGDNFLLNAELGAESALNSYLSLRFMAQNKYDNEPAEEKEKNDFSLVVSLNVKF